MDRLIDSYTFTLIFAIPGALAIISCYCSMKFGGSGIPFGGIGVALGFLLSPVKWPALLGLADPSVYSFIWAVFLKPMEEKRVINEFREFRNVGEPKVHEDLRLLVKVERTNEELLWNYFENGSYSLLHPKLWFFICETEEGEKEVIIKRKREDFEVKSFRENEVSFEDVTLKIIEKA